MGLCEGMGYLYIIKSGLKLALKRVTNPYRGPIHSVSDNYLNAFQLTCKLPVDRLISHDNGFECIIHLMYKFPVDRLTSRDNSLNALLYNVSFLFTV